LIERRVFSFIVAAKVYTFRAAMRRRKMRCHFLIGLALPFWFAQADAAEIGLLASNALKNALEEIAPQFAAASGHTIVTTYGSSGNLTARIDKGTPFDLAIVAADALDSLIGRGMLLGPRRDIARSGIGVSYRKGAAKPDVSTSAALKATLLAARSISFNPQGLSGSHMVSVIDRLGIAAAVKPKMMVPAVSASEDVAKGIAELGVTQIGEIRFYAAVGAELAGSLPKEFALDTVFGIAIGTRAQQPDAATALIAFLRSPAVVPILKAKGLEPG
jgi:molybdate transport system substrate-binding protein